MVAAEFFDGMARGRFVGLDGNEALALEIFARRHLQVRHENVAFALVAFVQAPEQPRQPGAVGFEERDFHFRMALENAAAEKAAEAEHLLEGLRVNPAQAEVRLEVFRALARARRGGLVEAERQIELFEQVPQRLVVRIVPVLAVDDIRAQKHRAKAVFFRDPARFTRRRRRYRRRKSCRRRAADSDRLGRNRAANRCRRAPSPRRNAGPDRDR